MGTTEEQQQGKSPVYAAYMDLVGPDPDNDQLVVFGGKRDDAFYPGNASHLDSVPVESYFKINRFLWEKAGSPVRIAVAFSADLEFLMREPQ